MRTFDVLVIGGANTDFLVQGGTMPRPGTTVKGTRFQQASGGKGANQAVASARLGAATAFIGCVSSDARGIALLDTLRGEGVDVSRCVIDPSRPTGAALVMVDARGEKQILTAPGANDLLRVEHVLAAEAHFAHARVVLLQLEVPLGSVETAARLGHAAGAKVLLDPAPPAELPAELFRRLYLIRPNAAEAQALTGVKVDDREGARHAGKALLKRGVRAACIGAPGGNLLVRPDGELWFENVAVHAVDKTGAGDALIAAFAVALARGACLPEAARFSTAAAALKTTRFGAQAGLPHAREVRRLLERLGPGETGVTQ